MKVFCDTFSQKTSIEGAGVVRLMMLFLLLVPASFSEWPQKLTVPERQALDRALEEQMRQDETVGLAVAVLRENQLIEIRGYGFEDRERQIPVSDKTLFRWASISKVLTALGALKLEESGKLDSEANVSSVVSEFDPGDSEVKIRHLLCHQSGVVHYSNGPVLRSTPPAGDRPYRTVSGALTRFVKSPLIHEPGARVSYSTHAYILLSAVVERLAGVPFDSYISQNLAVPLKLHTLTPDWQWEPMSHRAVGYIRNEDGSIRPSSDTDVSWKLGGGGYLSSMEDLGRLAEALLQRQVISRNLTDRLWSVQKLNSGKLTDWGLGMNVEHAGQPDMKVWHNGSQEKVRGRMVLYPNQGHGLVVMTNSEWVRPATYSTLIYKALKKAR